MPTIRAAGEASTQVVETMKNQDILLSTDGSLPNVIEIKRPPDFTRDDASRVVKDWMNLNLLS